MGCVTPAGRWCNKLDGDGRAVRQWEPEMRLDPRMIECVVYIYPDAPRAEAREGFGGTGFLVGAETTWGRQSFVVTNRHVVEDGHCTISFNNRDGKTTVLETDERHWRFHKDSNWDIAVHPITCEPHYKLLHLPMDMLLQPNDLERMDIRLGDELALLGRFINLDGRQLNTPTARFGHIVQLPGDPIKDDRGREQICFLAQIHSLPGFSGSPVFLIQNMAEKNAERNMVVAGSHPSIKLLGINCGHIDVAAPIFSAGSIMREALAAANTGVTRVLPGWVVEETIRAAIPMIPRASPLASGGFGFGAH